MGVPVQVFGDTYPKITGTVKRLQDFTVKGILGQDRLSGSANVQNLTFTGIEFHVPSEFPFLKGILIILENDAVILTIYNEVNCSIICKKPDL